MLIIVHRAITTNSEFSDCSIFIIINKILLETIFIVSLIKQWCNEVTKCPTMN